MYVIGRRTELHQWNTEDPGAVHTTMNNGLMTQVQQKFKGGKEPLQKKKMVLKQLFINTHTEK